MADITVIDHKELSVYSVVTNEEGEKLAVALRGLIKKRITEITEELKPARDQISAIRLEYKEQTDEIKKLKIADKVIADACSKFKKLQFKQVGEKKKELTVAQQEKDKVEQSPVPVTVTESVPNPEKIIRTTEGSMSYIPKIKVKVTDISKVPVFYDPSPMTERFAKLQLLVPNLMALNELLKLKKGYKIVDGKIISEIVGLEFYDELSTRVMK